MEMSEEDVTIMRDLAYMAGFFDGEGTITLGLQCPIPGTNDRTLQFGVAVGQVRTESLKLFEEYFGIPMRRVDRTKAMRPGVGYIHVIFYRGWRARTVLECLSPFLIQKKAQAELAIEILKLDSRLVGQKEVKYRLAKEFVEKFARIGTKNRERIIEKYEECFGKGDQNHVA